MQSTTQNNLDRKTTVPAIKPEVTEFFQREINPNMTPEQVKDVVNSLNLELNLKPNLKPNPIFGQILNLLYLDDSNNLAGIVVEDNLSSNTYTLAANPEINPESNTIKVNNLRAFQFRLQEAFNYNNLVSIKYVNGNIISLVIVGKTQNSEAFQDSIALRGSRARDRCCFRGHCPPKY